MTYPIKTVNGFIHRFSDAFFGQITDAFHQFKFVSDKTLGIIRTVSARWVFLLPNAIPLGLTENKQMKRVKELIQDIKKNWWIEGLEDWRIQIIQSKTHQSPNGKGGAE